MASQYLDRIKLGLSRVATMYTESPRFLAWLITLLSLQQDTENSLQDMALQTDLNTATGASLYTIATIVGAPIVYTEELLSYFIAWQDQTGGFTFADAEDSNIIGGRWRENGEDEITLTNLWEAQRLVIRCKIVKNHSSGSGYSIQRGMMFLFPNVDCIVQDNQDMSFSLAIGRYLSPIEKQLITEYDVLPRPVGVELHELVAYDEPVFGFLDQQVASGFDIGKWANLEFYASTTRTEQRANFLLIPTSR